MVPEDFTAGAGAFVAWTAAVGTGVGVTPPATDGTDVGRGTEVGGALLACGVAVAEDPQANSKATNNTTIALGRCRIKCGLDLDFGTALAPQ